MKFNAVLELHGTTATGIEVPAKIVEQLGAGKQPAVTVTLKKHTYRTTVAVRSGRYLIPVSAEHRSAAGVAAGDRIDVTIELDTAPRTIAVPPDLAAALNRNTNARKAFEALAPSHKKAHVVSIESAKTDETRKRRIAKAIDTLDGA